jgi:hypothetical protein
MNEISFKHVHVCMGHSPIQGGCSYRRVLRDNDLNVLTYESMLFKRVSRANIFHVFCETQSIERLEWCSLTVSHSLSA